MNLEEKRKNEINCHAVKTKSVALHLILFSLGASFWSISGQTAFLSSESAIFSRGVFPWVPTVLCDYIKSECWRERARVVRPVLMMQHYSETPLSEGFKSLKWGDLHTFKNGAGLDFKVSVYCDLEFLNWFSLIIHVCVCTQKLTSVTNAWCSHDGNLKTRVRTSPSHLAAYLINAYLKQEVSHTKSVACADSGTRSTWHARLLLLLFPLLPIFEL